VSDTVIAANDLIELARQLRRPFPPPAVASSDLAQYIAGANQGREQAAQRIEALLKEYGVEIQEKT
jgi:hypothetical protein